MGTNGRVRYNITLGEFTASFVPFALLLGAALLAAEATMELGFYRTVYTIWVTTALVTPALCAFSLPGDSARKRNIWVLFWTFSFVTYLVHAGYALFSVYQGSMKEFLAGQGTFPAIINVIFTAWWTLDVLLAWFHTSASRWVQIERVVGHWFIGLTFVASTVFLKHGFVNVIGIAMTLSVVICLLARFDAWRRAAVAPVAATGTHA
jgi:hypothetical protein